MAIGFAPIFVRQSEVGPVSTAVWRVVLAVPILWTIAALAPADRSESTSVPAGRSSGWWMMLVAGLFFAGDLAVWHWSIHFTSVANSTLLANVAPVFVVLYGRIAYGHRVTRRFLLAMLVAMGGMSLLLWRDLSLDSRVLFGDALALVTAVFYAGYLLSIKELRGRFPTALIMARTAVFTALALLPVAAVSHETFWPRTGFGWAMVGGLALVSQRRRSDAHRLRAGEAAGVGRLGDSARPTGDGHPRRRRAAGSVRGGGASVRDDLGVGRGVRRAPGSAVRGSDTWSAGRERPGFCRGLTC